MVYVAQCFAGEAALQSDRGITDSCFRPLRVAAVVSRNPVMVRRFALPAAERRPLRGEGIVDEATYRQFTTSLGGAYCDVLRSQCHIDACPQDGYEVFGKVFGFDDITPEKVHAAQMSTAQLALLLDTARAWHEDDRITLEHLREVVRNVLWRWPPEAI